MPHRRTGSRGQSIVELALVLPVILLIVLVGLDLGRAYLGWVVLNSAARAGADYASIHPGAWGTPGDPIRRATYDALVRDARADASGTLAGCDSVPVSAPAFPRGTDLGDVAEVTLTCQFSPITPLIGNIIGDAMAVTAQSLFPIRTGAITGPVIERPPGCPALADFTWAIDGTDPLRMHYTDTSSGTPSGWIWAFGDGDGSAFQSPSRTYASSGTYDVRLDVSGCSTITQAVAVTEPGPSGSADPSTAPGVSPSPTPFPGCVVPNFVDTAPGDAQATWLAAGFTTSIEFDASGHGNWKIQAQSLVGGQTAPCNVPITLGPKPIKES